METKQTQDEQNRKQGLGQNDPHSTAPNVTRPERAAHVDEVIQALKGITGLNADQKRVVDAQIAVLRGNPAGQSTNPESASGVDYMRDKDPRRTTK